MWRKLHGGFFICSQPVGRRRFGIGDKRF